MTVDDVTKLVNAGFTKADIANMMTSTAGTHKYTQVQQPATQVQQVQQVQRPAMQVQPPGQDMMAMIMAQNQMLQQMVNNMQTSAINSMTQPQAQTTDDILASVINPPGWDNTDMQLAATPANAAGEFKLI